MLLKNVRVLRPSGTKIQARGDKRYVYYVRGTTYKKDKRYNVDHRQLIGKMIDDEYMVPNDKYFEFFPDDIPDDMATPEFSDTLHIGASFLIDKILDKYNVNGLLADVFYDKAALIKDLITYMVIDESSVMQYFPEFMRRYPSHVGKVVSDATLCRFLKDMEDNDIQSFLDGWNKLNNGVGSVYVSYDGTNMNTSSEGIELAEFGYPKVDEGLPQVNISYAIRQDNGTPLMYEVYPGSISDMNQCKYIVDKLNGYGYKNIGLILDRGFYSKSNIEEIRKNGYEFLMMVKTNNKVINECIEEIRYKLKNDNKTYIARHKVYGMTLNKKLFTSDKKRSYIHIYYDNVQAAEDKNRLLNKVAKMEEELKAKVEKNKTCKASDLSAYKKFFVIRYDENGYYLGHRVNNQRLDKMTSKYGYFAMIGSEDKQADEALDIYRNRDIVEKTFMNLKSMLGMNKFRVQSDSSMEAKIFITFIASIVRNGIYQGILPLLRKDKKNYTIPAVIKMMDRIEITRNSNDSKYGRRYGLTAQQKKILSQFELDEKKMNAWVKSMGL